MAKLGTRTLSWVLALALLASTLVPFVALRPRATQAAVGAVVVTPTTTTVGAVSAYTISFSDTLAIAAGSVITIATPTTMQLQNVTSPGLLANITLQTGADLPAAVAAAAVAPAAVGFAGATGFPTSITITTPAGFAPLATAFTRIVIAAAGGLTNPPAETANDIFTISTNVATDTVLASADVVYTSATASLGFLPFPKTAGSVAQYTVPFTNTSAAGLVAGTDTVTVKFPAGVVLPASILKGSVSAGATATPNPLNEDPVVNTTAREVTLKLPGTVPAGTAAPGIGAGATGVVVFQTSALITNPVTGGFAGTAGSATGSSGNIATSQVTTPGANPGRVYYTRSLVNSPASGRRGTAVTSTASGFTSGSNVTLFVDTDADGVVDAGENILGTGTAGTDGKATITWTANAPAPLASGTNLTIRAIDNSGLPTPFTDLPTSTVNAASFGVSRSITLSQTSGARTTTVTLSGNDWLTGDAFAIGAATTGSTTGGITIAGLFCNPALMGALAGAGPLPAGVTCVIPATTPAGAATIRVFTTASPAAAVATATFTVTGAVLSLSPSTAVPGTPVTVSATGLSNGVGGTPAACAAGGFAAGPPPNGCAGIVAGTSIIFGAFGGSGLAGSWNTAIIGLDSSGNLPATILNVPAAAVAGSIPIVVTDNQGLSGTAILTVPARTITVSPTSSKRGSVLTITGVGYSRNSSVTITYTPPGIAATTAAAQTDANGNFTANMTVPNNAPINGTSIVAATDPAAGVGIANTNAAQHEVPAASIAVTPTSVPFGGTLTINGDGFPAFTSVTALTVGTTGALPAATINTDTDGKFTASILAPAQANPGAVTVSVTVGAGAAAVVGSANVTLTAAVANVATQLSALTTGATSNLQRAWAFDNATQKWKLYQPGAPAAVNDLTVLAAGDAVVLVVTSAATLTTPNFTRNLVAGTNIFGWR